MADETRRETDTGDGTFERQGVREPQPLEGAPEPAERERPGRGERGSERSRERADEQELEGTPRPAAGASPRPGSRS